MRNLLILLFIIFAFPALGQHYKTKFKLGLTTQEKLSYVLSLDQHTINKVRDTIFRNKERSSYVIAHLNLSNLSNDTLIYINMTCSTNDIFTINNKNIKLLGWACDMNIPEGYKIPPHKNSTFNFVLYFDKNQMGKRFKLGVYLIRPETKHWGFDIMEAFWKSREPFKDCLIWSNEVIIPIQATTHPAFKTN